MKHFSTFLILCLLIVFSSFSSSIELKKKASYIQFRHLKVNNGLSDNSCEAILKDSYGFMWFGTFDGLSKYDGYKFIVYRHNPTDTNSISNNYVTSLAEDKNGDLWVGTNGGGLNFYNREKDQFSNIAPIPDIKSKNIQALHIDKRNRLWIGTVGEGLYCFDLYKSSLKHYGQNNYPTDIFSIVEDNTGNIWLVNNIPGSISRLNTHTDEIKKWERFDGKKETVSDFIQKSILIDSKNNIWIGTGGNGLYKMRFDEEKSSFKLVDHYHPNKGNLTHEVVTDIDEDNDGNIWVSMDGGGITILSDKTNTSINLLHDPENSQTLSTNAVYTTYIDTQGFIWVGTFAGGINCYPKPYIKFQHFRRNSNLKNTLSHNSIIAVEEDQKGLIWIGTDGGGLNIFNKKNYSITPWKDSLGFKPKIIKSIKQDHKGDFWFGTYGDGLYKLSPETKKFKTYTADENIEGTISHKSSWVIYEDKNLDLWVGTLGGGLNLYNRQKDTFTHFKHDPNDNTSLSNDIIRAIAEDSLGNLWIGTFEGLNRYDRKTNSFKRFLPDVTNPHSINRSDIRALYATKKYLWVGTRGGGLNVSDIKTEEFIHFGEDDGLPGETIYGILEDGNDNLWICTANNGISRVKVKEDDKMNIICTNFDQSNGLQSNQFSYTASLKTKDNLLLFSGVNGFNLFPPSKISISKAPPTIVFTQLKVINENINTFGENSPLQRHINVANEITLHHNQNVFNVEYAALNFSEQHKTLYSYQLEGFDKNWQYAGERNNVTYTNLNPGTYTLKVKATNTFEVWGDDHTALTINIIPPWYNTLWAKISFSVLLIGLVIGGFRLRVNMLNKQKAELQGLIEQQTEELVNANIKLQRNHEKIAHQNDQLKEQILRIKDQQKRIEDQNNRLKDAQYELDDANKALKEMNLHLEQRVKTRTYELEKSNKELDKFVYSASHDISAPLKSILGLISLARTDQNPEHYKEYIDHMEKSVYRLDDVITNLIQYSQNTKREISYSFFNLHTKVNEIIEDLMFLNNAKDYINFINAIDDDLEIYSDEYRVKVILNNLISNAIKYYNPKQKQSYIKISFNQIRDEGHINVIDNGIGIKSEFLDDIYNMFYRATTHSSGAGLGLYIVNETIEKLNGKIEVDSEYEKGTVFTVILPNISPTKNS